MNFRAIYTAMNTREAFKFLLIILFCSCQRNKTKEIVKQDFATEIKQLVLNQNEKGQEYFFKLMKPNEVLEYKVTYIGQDMLIQKAMEC